MKPRGTIIVVGGNEEKGIPEISERLNKDFEVVVILEEIIKHAGGTESRIELLTCASDVPEDAGMIIKKGSECEVIGSGAVILLDGTSLDHNRINELKDDKPISLINLKVHFLAPKDKYYIDDKIAKVYNYPEYLKE